MSQVASSRHPHIWFKDMPINRFMLKLEDREQVLYANGDIFKSKEDGEEIMVDTVKKKPEGLFINLVSLDRTFNGSPIEYVLSSEMLFKYYYRTTTKQPFIEEGNYSVTVGD